MAKNGITKILTAPYHPNSNGIAERAVRTTKTALKKIAEGSFEERLARFLFNYRITPRAASGISPAVGMFGRPLRTRLDLLRESSQSKEANKNPEPSKLKVGEPVWVQNFRRGPKWVPGRIQEPLGNIMFRVQTSWGTWTRHADQIRKRVEDNETERPSAEHPGVPVAVLPGGIQQTTPVGEEEPVGNAQAVAAGPPVLSPQRDVVPILREHPPVLTPQCAIPQGLQSKSSESNLLRRSSRVKTKPQRLQFQ